MAGMKAFKICFTIAALVFGIYVCRIGFKHADTGESATGVFLIASGLATIGYLLQKKNTVG
jgi:hypothetical protein